MHLQALVEAQQHGQLGSWRGEGELAAEWASLSERVQSALRYLPLSAPRAARADLQQ